jgi:signal transduction histidine kinase
MEEMIDNLLSLARVTTGGKKFVRVSLGDVLSNVLSDLESLISSMGGRVESDSLPEITADRSQMEGLFANLIKNAMQYAKQGETPVLRISHRALVKEESDMDTGSPAAIELRFDDNGTGFNPEHNASIFKPFERLHSRGARQGLGIGLAICKRIVERHRGAIRADGRPGQGASFIIELPADQTKK